MKQTLLQVTFIDGETKVIEYEGDDLAGISKVLDALKKSIAAVHMRTLDEKGRVVFDRAFSYVPAEEIGE